MEVTNRKRMQADEYVAGILAGDRVMLSKAITLVESKLPSDMDVAATVLEKLLPHTGKAQRIGITGVPGVGKSTFIETFGLHLLSLNKSLAILTIDPSSQRSKGSILGDKTRMESLSVHPHVFIRPSSAGTSLGGVHIKTREALLLCEAFGFDVILIETVGVGQSEVALRGIVDFFLLLMLAGAGDELQGIKRGIMEMADAVIINKADGDNLRASELARREYQNALHLFSANESGWVPPVVSCSARENKGIAEIYEIVQQHEQQLKSSGFFDKQRQQQNVRWMRDVIMYYLETDFYSNNEIQASLPALQQSVSDGKTPAIVAARKLLAVFNKK